MQRRAGRREEGVAGLLIRSARRFSLLWCPVKGSTNFNRCLRMKKNIEKYKNRYIPASST
jgi:hypothetical protein